MVRGFSGGKDRKGRVGGEGGKGRWTVREG